MVSPSSSEKRTGRFVRVLLGAIVACHVLLLGCVTVRPEDKEFLAEPPMTFSAGGEARVQEEHVFTNREGSFGAGGSTGGGCGCN